MIDPVVNNVLLWGMADKDPIVEKINALWYSKGHREKLPIPATFPSIPKPFEWALDIARKDPALVSTAMRSAFKDGPKDDKMMYVSRGDATDKVKTALIEGVKGSAAVQLQVNGIDQKFPPFANFLENSIKGRLKTLHPYGFGVGMALWITGSEHIYNVHCDLGDHCLLQLHGKKIVKLYGPTPGFDSDVIFNFDFKNEPERFSGPVTEVVLNPGEMVYFSKGVMHEISIPSDTESVSVSIAAQYLYPVLNIVRDMNSSLGTGTELYKLQEKYAAWDKFSAYLFDPTRFSGQLSQNPNQMPEDLKQRMMQITLGPKESLSKDLDLWWANLSSTRKYSPTGSLPAPPENKIEILKQWEQESLSR